MPRFQGTSRSGRKLALAGSEVSAKIPALLTTHGSPAVNMKQFRPYVASLKEIVADVAKIGPLSIQTQIDAALDGRPSSELRRLVPLPMLRSNGAYFTGSALAARAAKYLADQIGVGRPVADLACGAGDLLVACTKYLPIRSSLPATLSCWESCLFGRDIHREFVNAARLRLILAAAKRCGVKPKSVPGVSDSFQEIQCGNGLTATKPLAEASAIIINPPFSSVDAPDGTTWANGSINSAGLFVERCVTRANPGTRIVAILPDVLRSGSRYEKWRCLIESRTHNRQIVLLDQFDKHADVHVFLFVAEIKSRSPRLSRGLWNLSREKHASKLADAFEILVGPVVDYREPNSGKWHPFLTAKALPAWDVVRAIPTCRRFRGRVLKPPFVLIRRTSRPEDRHRAIATIVAGRKAVAVENHLILVRPRNGKMAECKKLLRLLKRQETSDWLNRRIRCRHLTVSVLRNLPWPAAVH